MIKLDRIAAWTLFICLIAYGLTGYGMTKGLISQDFARSLHLSWLGAFALAAFIIHTGYAISLALRRHRIWNGLTKILLISFYVILAAFFLYLQFFYQGPYSGSEHSRPQGMAASTVATSSLPVFTAETLSKYDGLDGQPAYAAVDGLVYDLSSVFKNGNHAGHKAGQDLTSEFYSRHQAGLLSGYQVVGTYSAN